MSKLRFAVLPLALVLVACDADRDGLTNRAEKQLGTDPTSADSDGDGLSDGDEAALGSDALSADTDGDGLLDGEERDLGSDPTVADSDGDGYDDRSEHVAGTDASDPGSVIYVGGWPFNPDKDLIANPGVNGGNAVGDKLPRRAGHDQFGDVVDLYDFAHQGKPVILDISAEWCGPCREMAEWLEGGNNAYQQYNNVRRAVNSGEILWVTMIGQNQSGGQATKGTVERWYEAYPNHNVPVLVDRGERMTDWADLRYFPSTMFLDENLELQVWNPNNPTQGLAAISAYCTQNGLGERD